MDFFQELNAIINRAVREGVDLAEILSELNDKASSIREELRDE